MCYFKYSLIYIICIWFINSLLGAAEQCDVTDTDFSFNLSKTRKKPAEQLIWQLNQTDPTEPSLLVNVTGKHEDFKLTLFAIPYIETLSQCPKTLTGNERPRRHEDTCHAPGEGDKSQQLKFPKIFTGCYYLHMKNENGNWLDGPMFYNTSYKCPDIQLEILNGTKFLPEEPLISRELQFKIRVPANCIDVETVIYELKEEMNEADVLDSIRDENHFATRRCWFKRNYSEVDSDCPGLVLPENLKIQAVFYGEVYNGWIAKITWMNLRRGGGVYYLRLEPIISSCGNEYRFTWRVQERYLLLSLGRGDLSNVVPIPTTPAPSASISEATILPLSLSVASIVILAFSIVLYRHCKNIGKLKEVKDSVKLMEVASWPDAEHSNDILLLYGRGSSDFMNIMVALRDRLAQQCKCYVYDLYAVKEFGEIMELGPDLWIEKLMKAGNKIVWVDTPEFRSRLNSDRENTTGADFRDDAIISAVPLAIAIYQDLTTQYNYHFVVHVEGYEVDEESDDPLMKVTPLARYRIMEHIDLLCEHLTESVKRLEN